MNYQLNKKKIGMKDLANKIKNVINQIKVETEENGRLTKELIDLKKKALNQ